MIQHAQPDKHQNLLDRFIQDRNGKVVLWQTPNVPLIVWAVARMLEWPLRGQAQHPANLVGTLALTIWALLELARGASYFRRLLGLAVLLFQVHAHLS